MVHSSQRTGKPEEKLWEQEKLRLMLKSLMACTTTVFKYIKVVVTKKEVSYTENVEEKEILS